MKERFPDKNTEDSLEKELEYCHALISVIKEKEELCSYPKIQEKLNLLEESVKDDLEHPETSQDAEAKAGHKKADTSFFGYKTHIAMSEKRIITAATVTRGEKTDGKELPELVRKSRETGQKRMNLNLIKMQGCTSVRQGIWQSINIWTDVKKKRRIRTRA